MIFSLCPLYESVFVMGIYRPPDQAKLSQFDSVPGVTLTRLGANDCFSL